MASDIIEALRESEERYRTLFEQAPVGVFLYDRALRVTACNPCFVRIIQSSREQVIGFDLRTLKDRTVIPAIEGVFSGESAYYEGPYETTTSAVHILIRLWLAPLRDGHATVVGGMGVVEDVTGKVRAEETLKQFESRFRYMIEQAPDAIGVSRAGSWLYVNPKLVSLLGHDSPDTLIGRSVYEFIFPDDLPAFRRREPRLQAGTALPPEECRVLRRDGSIAYTEISVLQIDYDGAPAIFAMARDISERKLMQARLLQADRMASLGTLVAGVAHEINNPLAYLIAHLDIISTQQFPHLTQQIELLEQGLPHDGSVAGVREEVHRTLRHLGDMVGVIRDGAERVQRIVRDLKAFSRAEDDLGPSSSKPALGDGPVDIRRILDASVNLAWNEIRHRARLIRQDGETPLVDASPSRLGQLFLNLLLNAAQALPPGNVAGHSITLRSFTDALGRAVVEVSDTGHGVAEGVRHRIFDPFFTTKPIGEGTGLGLWICQSIVQSVGGEIGVESRPGATTFRVVLPPSHTVEAKSAAASVSPEPPARRRGRVLVIDDEAFLARVIASHLSDEHDVTIARSGREALDQLRRDRDFDAILCDLMMPDWTGQDVYEELARDQADLCSRIIFMTGGAFTPQMRKFLEGIPNAQLDKPFATGELRDQVRRAVRRRLSERGIEP